jgi:hypothetical protein
MPTIDAVKQILSYLISATTPANIVAQSWAVGKRMYRCRT